MRDTPQRVAARLPHATQRRSLGLLRRRIGKIPQLVQRSSSERQDGSRALIPGGRLSFEPVEPAPELGWPIDIHNCNMTSKPYYLQVISACEPVTVRACEANWAMVRPGQGFWRSLQEPRLASAADKPALSWTPWQREPLGPTRGWTQLDKIDHKVDRIGWPAAS